MSKLSVALVSACVLVGATAVANAEDMADMTFFVTSAGSGDGANLGGLAGADFNLCIAGGGGRRRWQDLARLPFEQR